MGNLPLLPPLEQRCKLHQFPFEAVGEGEPGGCAGVLVLWTALEMHGPATHHPQQVLDGDEVLEGVLVDPAACPLPKTSDGGIWHVSTRDKSGE